MNIGTEYRDDYRTYMGIMETFQYAWGPGGLSK